MEEEKKRFISNLEEVKKFELERCRRLHSATHQEILQGLTTDIYWIRTYEVLRKLNLLDTPVMGEVFARESGVLAGVEEVLNLLQDKKVAVWSLQEGEDFQAREIIMRIEGPYGEFGLFETVFLGMLASASGWATAARQCKQAAGNKPVICFGSRHVHPSVAPVMERAARIGGVDGVSCILAAKLLGEELVGTMPHSLVVIIGDTLEAALAFHKAMPPGDTRIILVDTFKDEAEEALRVASALKDKIYGVRLDTPAERGRVTPELVEEVRKRLDLAGYPQVKIFVSGGLDPERITLLSQADAFGVGNYISGASPIDMTFDLREVNGLPRAKRGRIPGRTDNKRLKLLKSI